VLAVWSPQRNPVFLETLRQVFPDVEEIATTAISRAAGEIPDVVYLASR
jgi:hypothetical protein